MLRIHELKLPLEHDAAALKPALLKRLGISEADLVDFTIHKRAWDARKKGAIQLIYTIDAEVKDEAALLKRHAKDVHIGPAPDMSWTPPARASGPAWPLR